MRVWAKEPMVRKSVTGPSSGALLICSRNLEMGGWPCHISSLFSSPVETLVDIDFCCPPEVGRSTLLPPHCQSQCCTVTTVSPSITSTGDFASGFPSPPSSLESSLFSESL